MKEQDSNFDALLKEAQFTCEMLCAGVTQIRNANYARRGIYFQAFTSLSTGYERIGKLCILLDYMLTNNGLVPEANFFQGELRHNLIKIYEYAKKIKDNRNYQLNFTQSLDSEEHLKILSVLSRFAKGDRYANFDLIFQKRDYDDPIKKWYQDIDLVIYNSKISSTRKAKIEYNAMMCHALMDQYTMVVHTSEDEKEIDNVYKGSYQTGIIEAVGPYRQLYTFQIVRYFMEILTALQRDCMPIDNINIPYFNEVFRVFFNDDNYVKGRKTWEMM